MDKNTYEDPQPDSVRMQIWRYDWPDDNAVDNPGAVDVDDPDTAAVEENPVLDEPWKDGTYETPGDGSPANFVGTFEQEGHWEVRSGFTCYRLDRLRSLVGVA